MKTIHLIGRYAEDDKNLLERSLKPRVRSAVEIKAYADNLVYANAVRPDALPHILVLGNRLEGMSGTDFAAKLRAEGYTGKIFIFTGGLEVEKSEYVDAVFYKPDDAGKIQNALVLALHAIP